MFPWYLQFSFSFGAVFMYLFGLYWVFIALRAFLQLRQVGATLCCSAQASYCGDFSCCEAWALGAWATAVAAHRLSGCGFQAPEHRLNWCGAQAQLV